MTEWIGMNENRVKRSVRAWAFARESDDTGVRPRFCIRTRAVVIAGMAIGSLAIPAHGAQAESLAQALARAYQSNPQLRAARATMRIANSCWYMITAARKSGRCASR